MNKNAKIKLHTGSEMPVLGLGTWQLNKDTPGTVRYALEIGYRMIDTSSDYGTHKGIARALAETSVSREDIYLVTKVEEDDDAYDRTISNLEELGISYADLMLIHRPPEHGAGEDLWNDLIRAKKEGLVKDIGVSNYSAAQIDALIASSGEIPVVNQIEWSPFGRSDEMEAYCLERGIVIQAYSPLTRTKRLDHEALVRLGKKHDKSPAQIVIRWNLERGTVPLPKANQKKHLEENIDVFDFALDYDDMRSLHALNEEYSSLGSLPYVQKEVSSVR